MTIRTGTRAAALFIAWLIAIEVAFATPCPRYEIVEFWPTPDLCDGSVITLVPRSANDHGQFVGRFACGPGPDRAFRFDFATRSFEVLAPPAGSRATDINDAGTIVGFTASHLGFVEIGWYIRNGRTFFVEPPPSLATTAFTCINEDGLIGGSGARAQGSGRVAFVFDPKTATFDLFGDELTPYYSEVEDLAETGTATGWFIAPDQPSRPYARTIDGDIKLGLPCDPDADPAGRAYTNDDVAGTIGGYCGIPVPGPTTAALWTDGRVQVLPGIDQDLSTSIHAIASADVVYGYQGISSRVIVWDHRRPSVIGDRLFDREGRAAGPFEIVVHVDAAGRVYGLAGQQGFGFPDLAIIAPAPVVGDYTCDDTVDFDDLLRVIAAWGPCTDDDCPFDIDDDGWVDGSELLIVLEHWTR